MRMISWHRVGDDIVVRCLFFQPARVESTKLPQVYQSVSRIIVYETPKKHSKICELARILTKLYSRQHMPRYCPHYNSAAHGDGVMLTAGSCRQICTTHEGMRKNYCGKPQGRSSVEDAPDYVCKTGMIYMKDESVHVLFQKYLADLEQQSREQTREPSSSSSRGRPA